jgi:putative Flp pilus-assembly TadE/G-like protein
VSARLRSESGQVVALVPVLLTVVLLGVAALAIDVGVWFTASRHVQGVADAAALAAVQDLPTNPAAAQSDVIAYASANDGTLDGPPVISSSSPATPNDTITVQAKQTVPAFFAKLIGLSDITVHGSATAEADGASFIQGGGYGNGAGRPVPFAVSVPTWTADGLDKPVTLTFGPANPTGSGNFGLLDFAGPGGGTPRSTLVSWITDGYPGQIGPGTYGGVPGNRFNSVKAAMSTLNGKLVTVPVFSSASGPGGNLLYTVVGWAAFKIDPQGINTGGPATTISGQFVSLQVNTPGPPTQYFGVGHVKLTK